MKLFKVLILILLLSSISVATFLVIKNSSHKKEVIETKEDFYSKLDLAIKTANLEIKNLQKREYLNQVEFFINDTRIILSTQKDPTWQVASLQEVFKTAKMNRITLINLSIDHPYATFKNN